MEPRNVIFRHSAPTVMDESPRGSACIVKHDNDMDLYLQIHQDNEIPKWELIDNVRLDTPQRIIDELLNHRLQ